MHVLFINLLNGNEIIRAICWTLLHSLWQGLLLAVAGGIVVLFTKKQRPSLRYNLLSGLFLLFVVTACLTFVTELHQSVISPVMKHNTFMQLPAGRDAFSKNIDSLFQSRIDLYTNQMITYFDRYASLLVLTWFIILTIRSVKICYGLRYIKQIRHTKIKTPDSYWKNRIQELKEILRVSQPIVLLESGIIKVPMAVGWLKPVILVPMGILTHLPTDQLEAILLHELAHIKRRDYFVNIVQSFAEVIFFFNPAVLWISSLIREERENCCDDMAIAVTKNKTRFINALVSFQEYNSSDEYAMCFPGRKYQLLNRVQRIIHNSNNSLNTMEKTAIAFCCMAIGLLTVVVASPVGKKVVVHAIPVSEKGLSSSPIPQKLQVVQNIKHASEPAGDLRQVKLSQKKQAVKKAGRPTTSVKIAEVDHPPLSTADTTPVAKVQLAINNIIVNTRLDLSVRMRNLYTTRNKILLKNVLIETQPLLKIAPLNNVIQNLQIKISQPSYKLDTSFNKRPAKPAPRTNPLSDPVIKDLIKERIINESVIINMEDFSYTLSNTALIVQGIRQTQATFEKFYKKYIPATGNTIHSYRWRN